MGRVLTVHGLTKAYLDGASRRAVLESFDLEAEAGEMIALTGPSGSGKSTLLNLLSGMLVPDAGRIALWVGDQRFDFSELEPAQMTRLRRRHIGYVFQFFNLVPTLTVRENVLLPLELNGLEQLQEEALERLAKLGLSDRLDDFPAHLSGGERQRTAIARALAHRPALVLADEPTGNLDAANAEQVVAMLRAESKALSSTLVMATHNDAVAVRADQIVRLPH